MGPGCGSATNWAFTSIEFDRPLGDVPGHLVILAAPTTLSAPDAVNYPSPASDRIVLKPVGQMQVAGSLGDVFQVSEDSETAFSGHTVVVWTVNGDTYAAGIHGTDPASSSMNESIIGALVMVAPH